MTRGAQVSDETIERIKATFAETGNLRATARACGCSQSTAKKYAGSRDDFEQVRAVKRLDIIDHIKDAQIKLIDAMTDPDKLKSSSIHDIGVAFGIVTDKGLLLSGQATARTENIGIDPRSVLTPDELAAASRIRAKLSAD